MELHEINEIFGWMDKISDNQVAENQELFRKNLIHFQETTFGSSSRKFALMIGINEVTYLNVVNQKSKTNPNLSFIIRLIGAFTDLNLSWLLTGKGEIYKSKEDRIILGMQKAVEESKNKNVELEKKIKELENIIALLTEREKKANEQAERAMKIAAYFTDQQSD